MAFDKEFFPLQYGAFESSYSRSEESGAMGCGIAPKCNEQKWITEKQTKCTKILGKNRCITYPHQKQVPNMTCVIKKQAYKACLQAAGQPTPDDFNLPDGPELPDPDDSNTNIGGTTTAGTNTQVTKKSNTTMYIAISVLVLVLFVATILIIRHYRNKKQG